MERKHYYMRVPVNTATGRKIDVFIARCNEVSAQAREWACRQGARFFYESAAAMAGGVDAVEFSDGEDRAGWERLDAPDGRVLFFPHEGTEKEKEMKELPVVSETDAMWAFELLTGSGRDGTFGRFTPVIFRHRGYWYADMPYMSNSMSAESIPEKEFYRRRLAALNSQREEDSVS